MFGHHVSLVVVVVELVVFDYSGGGIMASIAASRRLVVREQRDRGWFGQESVVMMLVWKWKSWLCL